MSDIRSTHIQIVLDALRRYVAEGGVISLHTDDAPQGVVIQLTVADPRYLDRLVSEALLADPRLASLPAERSIWGGQRVPGTGDERHDGPPSSM